MVWGFIYQQYKAGGVKSNSGAVGMHRIQGPNSNSHFGGFIKR
jgi:hypothetical protein